MLYSIDEFVHAIRPDGLPLTKDDGEIHTIRELILRALREVLPEDRDSTHQKKLDTFRLIQKLAMKKGHVDITSDELTIILERSAKLYPQAEVSGRIAAFFADYPPPIRGAVPDIA